MDRKPKILIVVCVVFLILILSGTLFICWITKGPKQEVSNNVEDYGEWSLPEKYSTLSIFPGEIPSSASDISYYYKFQEGWNRPICQLFLACSLSEEEYKLEKERLMKIAVSGANAVKRVKYDERAYMYPAYVAIEGYDFCYEYALINDTDRRIFYVYAMNTIYRDVQFDRKYLPDYYMEDFENLKVDGMDRFSVYVD